MRTVFRAALVVALLGFGLFSSYVVWKVGYLGIWRAGLANLGAMQILADLVIMATLLLALMWRDARRPAVVQPTSGVAAFTLSTAAVKAANLFDNEFLLERRHCRLRLGQGRTDVARARADVLTVEAQ